MVMISITISDDENICSNEEWRVWVWKVALPSFSLSDETGGPSLKSSELKPDLFKSSEWYSCQKLVF